MPSFKDELWRTPDLLGFAAHWIWIWCVFWSSLFYGEGTLLDVFSGLAGPLALEPLWVVSLLANVVTIAFLLMCAGCPTRVARSPPSARSPSRTRCS